MSVSWIMGSRTSFFVTSTYLFWYVYIDISYILGFFSTAIRLTYFREQPFAFFNAIRLTYGNAKGNKLFSKYAYVHAKINTGEK